MKTYIVAYVSTLLVMLVLDGLWLGVLMGSTYKSMLGSMMLDKPLWGPAGVFYLLYAFGLLFFAVNPALGDGGVWRALGLGAMVGLIAYGTYDLTNWATLTGWPPRLAMMDLAWGIVVSALVAAASVFATQKWGY